MSARAACPARAAAAAPRRAPRRRRARAEAPLPRPPAPGRGPPPPGRPQAPPHGPAGPPLTAQPYDAAAGAASAVGGLGPLPPIIDQNEGEGEYEGLSRRKDILVVGPGELGRRVLQAWAARFPEARVVAQTRTADNHEALSALGIEGLELRVGSPSVPGMEVDLEGGLEAEDGEGKDRLESLPLDDPEGGLDGGIAALLEAQQRMDSKFPYVLYCAPPSGAAADGVEYADTVYAACQQWNKAGGCVFTSSSAVYYGDDGAFCTEETPALPMGASERSDRLLRAEDACVNHGGCVVRLAGLYHAQRGAHMFYLKQGEVKGRGDALLNLIHYDDAASLVVETLLNGGRCRRYMGVDSSPVSKADVVDATLRSGRFDDMAPEGGVKFASEGVGPTGRRMDNVRTRKMLSWAPRHRSFADFMQAYGRGDAEL